jgi:hypothetical protein
MAGQFLREAGFEGQALDIMLGIEWVECLDPNEVTCTCHPDLPPRRGLHFYDAVGDVGIISAVWGPSIGPGQVRSLRHPNQYPFPDTLRVAPLLLDPTYNARACWEISEEGTDFMKWTPFRPDRGETYKPHVGKDFELHSGHFRAHLWNS